MNNENRTGDRVGVGASGAPETPAATEAQCWTKPTTLSKVP